VVAAEDTGDVTDAEVVDRYRGFAIDPDNKEFYKGWLRRQLVMQRCAACGHWHHPPAPICPRCWSEAVVPTQVSGDGTVHLLIRLHQGPPAPGVDYAQAPYPVVAVELAEQPGLRFTSTVVNCTPDELHIGLAVSLTWIERSGAPFPVFEPAKPRA
jgi:uncharacterized OB-fold protein